MRYNIVGRNAGLTDVEELAENDAFCREIDFSRFVYDDGAFAAEFERLPA